MRREFNVRVRIPEQQGREIHEMALRENRSQSSAISVLVAEALTARRAAAVEEAEIMRVGQTAKLVEIILGIQSPKVAS
jgi:hypothetical protein